MTQLELSRRVLKLSQGALGRKLLYSKAVVSRLESGALPVKSVHPRLRHSLETFFNVPLEQLLAPVPPEKVAVMVGLDASRDR